MWWYFSMGTKVTYPVSLLSFEMWKLLQFFIFKKRTLNIFFDLRYIAETPICTCLRLSNHTRTVAFCFPTSSKSVCVEARSRPNTMYLRKAIIQVILLFNIAMCPFAFGHDCIYNDSQCTCSLKPASGICYRQQSPGICKTVQCNPSWKCDCFAPSHICTRRACNKFEPVPGASPDASGGVRCQRATSPLCATSLIPLGPQATPTMHHRSHSPTPDREMETTLSPSPSPSPSPTCHPDDHDRDDEDDNRWAYLIR